MMSAKEIVTSITRSQLEIAALNAQVASYQTQAATLGEVLDTVRAEASEAVRELREGLATEQQRAFALQQRIDSNDANRGRKRDWTLVSSKEFCGRPKIQFRRIGIRGTKRS